jgi:hypothetical protein
VQRVDRAEQNARRSRAGQGGRYLLPDVAGLPDANHDDFPPAAQCLKNESHCLFEFSVQVISHRSQRGYLDIEDLPGTTELAFRKLLAFFGAGWSLCRTTWPGGLGAAVSSPKSGAELQVTHVKRMLACRIKFNSEAR